MMPLIQPRDHSLVALALRHGDDLWCIEELVIVIFVTQVSFP